MRRTHLAGPAALGALLLFDAVVAPSWAWAGPYPPTAGCAAPLVYCGGPVVSAPVVIEVSWDDPGAQGSVPAAVESYLQGWWPAILSAQAGYLGWLTEYDTAGLTGLDGQPGSGQVFTGSGTFGGLYRITPAPAHQGAQLDDAMIAAELAAQITSGGLPAPSYDGSGLAQTIYVIDFPPRVTAISVTLGGVTQQTCAALCGYHTGTQVAGKPVYYAVVPDLTTCGNCAPDGLEPDLGLTHSHELTEAMTDPEAYLESLSSTSTTCARPGAWDQLASGCGEIADACESPGTIPTVTVGGQSFYVQGLYDNLRRDCETSAPVACSSDAACASPEPLCDPALHVCRACRAADCSGTTPACATAGPHAGACVACADDSGCTADLHQPICDAQTNVCRPCVPSDCVALTPVCATSGPWAGRCVADAADGGMDAATAVDGSPDAPIEATDAAGAPADGPLPREGGFDPALGQARGSSCGCRAAGSRGEVPAALAGVALLSLRRRRRQGR